MTQEWHEYLGLLEEAAGLPEQEARGVADADSAYNAEARRLQNSLARAQRELDTFKARNTRLQVGVRDLSRSLGLTIPVDAASEPLPLPLVGDAIKAAEYDLDQIRKSVEHLKTQKQAAVFVPITPPIPSVSAPAAPSESSAGGDPMSRMVLVGAGLGIVVFIILAVILL